MKYSIDLAMIKNKRKIVSFPKGYVDCTIENILLLDRLNNVALFLSLIFTRIAINNISPKIKFWDARKYYLVLMIEN